MTRHTNPPHAWEHPLIRTLDRPVSRRAMLAGAALTLLPSTRAVAQEMSSPDVATPSPDLDGEAEAVALLESAVEAISALETFAFELDTTRGKSTIFQGLELKGVEGVVRRPLDIQATVTVGTPLSDITVSAIGLDGEFWVQDPLSDGGWISMGSDPQIQSLINPDALLLYAVRLVQDAQITGTEKIYGVETTLVEGTVDFVDFLGQFGQGQMELTQLIAEGPKDVAFWIDDENRVVESEIRGPIFASESDDVVRVLGLFDFNEPVEIERPEGL